MYSRDIGFGHEPANHVDGKGDAIVFYLLVVVLNPMSGLDVQTRDSQTYADRLQCFLNMHRYFGSRQVCQTLKWSISLNGHHSGDDGYIDS